MSSSRASTASSVAPDTQRQFLNTAVRAGVTTWVKIVIGATTDLDQFDQAVGMVAEAARLPDGGPGVSGITGGAEGRRRLEVFLQPVTPFGDVNAGPSPDQVLRLQERALRTYPCIRVVPQTHKAIGQL